MSMFQILKRDVPLRVGIEHYTGKTLSPLGSRNAAFDDKECPFCGHSECFRAMEGEEDGLVSFRCFSCGRSGSDTVAFCMEIHNAHSTKQITSVEAAKKVAEDFNIPWEAFLAVQQEILDITARFYHQCLFSNTDRVVLSDGQEFRPMDYQVQYRKHLPDTLEEFEIGWSAHGAGLPEFLDGLGYSVDDCVGAGVLNRDKDGRVTPVFWPGVFIYPHFVNGKVSHLTQKSPDPLKPAKYQMKSEFSRNGYVVYGQDDVPHAKNIFVVEGENDRISLWEELRGRAGIVAVIGQPSKKQCDWLAAHLKDKSNVYTVFDNDSAGDKYRTLFQSLGLPNLKQLQVPLAYKDIDEYLKKDPQAGIEGLLPAQTAIDTDNAKISSGNADSGPLRGVFEEGNCYYRLSVDKKGNAEPVKVSDFVMRLRRVYVYEKDDTRDREIDIIREDGSHGQSSLIVDSSVKTKLFDFRKAVADAADVTFYGTDSDLQAVWAAVYALKEEKTIHVPMEVGHQATGGWVFRDCFISKRGEILQADPDGLIPVGTHYLFPMGATVQTTARKKHRQRTGIPSVIVPYDKTPAETAEFSREFCRQFIANIGDIGLAVSMLAWAKACAFSHQLFEHFHFFPFLYIWGKYGKGKSTVSYWLLQLYGMRGIGEASLSRLESGVGFNRMLATYSSLPVLLEEMRANREAADLHGSIRSWYNRIPRSMGDRKDSSIIVSQPVRACLMFNGEDVLTDPAARSRCVEFQLPDEGKRDLDMAYTWLESHSEELPSIGLGWIQESLTTDMTALIQDMKEVERLLIRTATKDSRVAKQWSIIGVFADHILADLGVEDYGLEAFLINACQGRSDDIKEESIVSRFFHMVDGIQVQKNSAISGEHIRVCEGQIFLWVSELWQICYKEREALRNSATTFSSRALMSSLKSEPYYVGYDSRKMGMSGASKKVVILKMDEGMIPDSLKSIIAQASAE